MANSPYPFWYYSGRVTTPVELPGGAVIITPRSKFHAPPSAVAHLVQVGLVKRLPDPKPIVQQVAVVATAARVPPPAVTKSVAEKPSPVSIDPGVEDNVVASAEVDVASAGEGDGSAESQPGDGTSVPVESESELPRESRRRRRDRNEG